MARRPRLNPRGAIAHVMSRGNRKQSIFEDDHDRRRFLEILETTTTRHDISCYAYCLMGNHYHVVFETPRPSLSDAMRDLNGIYAQYYNRQHNRNGHTFEGRFASILVGDAAYLRDLCRYVVLNPVKARLVSDAVSWEWSSYRATAGIVTSPTFLWNEWIDAAFGGRTHAEAQERYRLFVNDDALPSYCLDPDELVTGSGKLEYRAREHLGNTRVLEAVPRKCKTLSRPPLGELFKTCATLESRDALIQRAHVVYGYRLAEIASFLGLHRSTASAAVRRLEREAKIRSR